MHMYATKSFPLYFHSNVIMTFETLPVPDVNTVIAKCVVKCMLITEELSQKPLFSFRSLHSHVLGLRFNKGL